MNETPRVSNWLTPLRFGVILALLIIAAFPQVIFGSQTFVIRDYGFFSYPNAFFQRDCFWHGQLPYWNPYNECGVPFLAQWNTMPLYPLSLVYQLLPLPWSLSFFCLLHLWLAGMGMYSLARRWTGNDFAAAFAGLTFAFNGLSLNLLMWPSHIATFAWMPWVVLVVENAWRQGGRQISVAAIVGAMQMLAGGPETIFLTWTLLAALWLRHFVKGDTARWSTFWRFPLVIFLVFALSAAQLIPFLDLASQSQRQAGYADLHWSMPAAGWANFLVPMAFGNTFNMGVFFQHGQTWTSSYYLGIAALWLALLAIWRCRQPRMPLLAIAAVVAFVFALGENTPIYPLLWKIIPALSLMTYPVKYVLLLTFVACLLAAFAIVEIQKGIGKGFLSLGLLFLALIGIILFLVSRYSIPGEDVHAALANGAGRAIFVVIITCLFFLMTQEQRPSLRRIAPGLLLLAAWLDVLTHEPPQNPLASPSIYSPGLARQKLAMNPAPEPGLSRVMATPAAVDRFAHTAITSPQNNFLVARLGCQAECNLLDRIPKVDGFYSLVPHDWARVRVLLYNESPADLPGLEQFLGVCQVTATNDIYQWQARSNFLPLVTTGQKPVFREDADALRAMTQPDFDGGRVVFLHPYLRPWVDATNETEARILKTAFDSNDIEIDADATAPTFVVVAQTFYHDWHAFVDGRRVSVYRANVGFQAVPMPKGRHHIRLLYIDSGFRAGLGLSVITLLGCLALPVLRRRKN